MANPQPFGPPEKLIDLGHSRVPYYRVGRGPDVFFLHGWPLYSATFRDIVPKLSDRYTCHLIDLPGTGDSKWSTRSKIGLREHAESARHVVDQLGLTSYAIVAHDSGAVIARLMAAQDERVRGLVLGNTEIPGYHCWQVQVYVWVERVPLAPWLFGVALRLPAVSRSSLAWGGSFSDPHYVEGEFKRLFIDRMNRSLRYTYGQRRLIQNFDWSLIDGLADVHAKIQAPVKFIWGMQDPYFPLSKLKPTLNQFRNATLGLIDPGKLFAHDEYPEKFVAETRPFLEQCFAESQPSAAAG